ncbi:radical SAM protein, partial [Myxococcota bacterium]|nr:radical SAM protein [Myxococcota bacterium]
HPSFMWKETLDFEGFPVDIVAIGEAEDTLADILDVLVNKGDLATVAGVAYLKDGVAARTAIRPRSLEIPERPMAWDLLDWSLYTYFVYPGSRLAAISTSRGCSHSCTFCSQQKFWEKSWRGREATPVVDELELLAKTYKVDVVLFTDEYPTPDRERWEALLDAIIERDLGMKILIETRAEDIVRDEDILSKYVKAGIVHVYVGLEATDQERLDLIKKDNDVQTGIRALELLTEYGILSETSFVLGFPDETPEKVARTLELSKMYAPDFAHYLAIAPWPYADMWDDLKDHVVVHDYRRYNLVDPVVKPIAMSLDDIDNAIVDCYRSFYTHKMIVMATDKNPERKDYLLRSMKLIMGSSFVRKKMMGGKGMPPEMRELLKKLGVVKERPASAAVGESKGTADL